MEILEILCSELNIRRTQAEAAVKLLDDGNTVHFIARYRKEVTGGLNDEVLRKLETRLNYLRNLQQRKEDVIRLIDEKGMLTEELKTSIMACNKLVDVEDLYRHTVYGKFFEDKLIHKIKQSVTLDEVNNTLREIFNDYTIQCQVYGDAGKKDIYSLKQIKKKFNNYTK